MAVRLNERAFEHAKSLVVDGRFVHDDRDAWSEHQPSAADENRFIEEHGFGEYGRWYLGIDDAEDDDNKGHTSSRTATSTRSTGAGCWRRSHGPASASTSTSSSRSRTCTA